MATGDSAGLKLQSLPSLFQTGGDANNEGRYHHMLKGIAHLTAELTLMLSGLHVHVSEDLKFIMSERADLRLQRAALDAEKDCNAKLTEAVEEGMQVVNAAKAPTEDEKVVVDLPREVDKLSLAASTWQRTTPDQEPATGKRGQEKYTHITPKVSAAYTESKYSSRSEGRLPAWLNCGELSATPAVRAGGVPEPQRPQDFHSVDTRTEDAARATELRREWLEMKGEQAHRFMTDKQEDRSKHVGFPDDSDDVCAGAGASANDGNLSSRRINARRTNRIGNVSKFFSAA